MAADHRLGQGEFFEVHEVGIGVYENGSRGYDTCQGARELGGR